MTPTKSVLLVEDEPMDVELVKLVLGQCDLADKVFAVYNGAEALDYLHRRNQFSDRESGEPRLVLLDLKMPRVDGFEVLRQIKSHLSLKTIPVVVLTSSVQTGDIARAYALGANAYLVKHIDFAQHAESLKAAAQFWLHINTVPPGSVQH